MSYQDTLDKKKSIQAAKKELEDFSDLIKLHSDLPIIQGIRYGGIPNLNAYTNHDQIQLHRIEKKDEQLQFIFKVLQAMDKLEDDEMQVLYMKYVLMYCDERIMEILNYAERSFKRKLNSGSFKIAIKLEVDIKKK